MCAVVGVAGDEVFVRWLAGVKNSMNSTVVKSLRRSSGEFSGTADEELAGGASQRGEKGGEWEIRVDGGYLSAGGRRFVLRILWSERKRRTVGCVTRVLNPKR